jgi:hypothetical protein
VYRRDNRHLAELLTDRLFILLSRRAGIACVCLGRGVRKRAKAYQREKDARKDEKYSNYDTQSKETPFAKATEVGPAFAEPSSFKDYGEPGASTLRSRATAEDRTADRL